MDSLMTIWVFFIGIIIGILIGVILSYRTAVNPLQHTIKKLTFPDKYSLETMKYYPYNPDNFRFVGDPIDGIQFEENAIVFVRFKKDNTPRTKEQNHIKILLENRNVKWFEFTTK
jgi:predicted Holliday junction resolvase-like endonuclease